MNLRKKLFIASMITACFATVSFANQSLKPNVKASFVPTNWVSLNKKDIVSIKVPTDGYSSYYEVQIHVDTTATPEGTGTTGININNCNGLGSVDHVAPSSSIICGLTKENPVLTFSSDSDKMVAVGQSQIG